MRLVVCHTCRRHTAIAAACVHCGGYDHGPSARPRQPGLSRAALFASSALVAAQIACGAPGQGAGPDAPRGGGSTETPGATPQEEPVTAEQSVYGGPPPPEPSTEEDAGPTTE